MTEKTYKVMGLAGGANIAIGIISIVVGVTTGIILLVSGGKLLGAKSKEQKKTSGSWEDFICPVYWIFILLSDFF